MTNRINPLRHLELFDPEAFGDRSVTVIGAGAIGSHAIEAIASLGVRNLTVCDFDVVDAHNLGNQAFDLEDIGKPKTEAMAKRVKRKCGLDIKVRTERITGSSADFGEVVFLFVDKMSVRREIYEGALKLNLSTRFLVEARIGVDTGRVYWIDPNNERHCSGWEGTLYPDPPEQPGVCKVTSTIGATAGTFALKAVWRMIEWFEFIQGKRPQTPNHEWIHMMREDVITTRRFD